MALVCRVGAASTLVGAKPTTHHFRGDWLCFPLAIMWCSLNTLYTLAPYFNYWKQELLSFGPLVTEIQQLFKTARHELILQGRLDVLVASKLLYSLFD